MRSDRVRLGAIALTFSPCGPSSQASLRVSAMLPPLAVAYSVELSRQSLRPALDDRVTLLWPRSPFLTGIYARGGRAGAATPPAAPDPGNGRPR